MDQEPGPDQQPSDANRAKRIEYLRYQLRVGTDPATFMAAVGTTNPNHKAVKRLQEQERERLADELLAEISRKAES